MILSPILKCATEGIEAMSPFPMPPEQVLADLRHGLVIPAHPLALDGRRRLDERRQRALTRYYADAGAGGIAVGVHTTQFEIRRPEHGLYAPVLELASATLDEWESRSDRRLVRIAGICGQTGQALNEARTALDAGYHAGLLSLSAWKEADDDRLIGHCRAVAEAIPLVGFYLQPAAGGRLLPFSFWRRFAEIPHVIAVKIAPFNRYQTLDVLRGVAEAGRAGDIALYTGNDDHIVADLLTEYEMEGPAGKVRLGMKGGLLGHWACWTRRAVELLAECRAAREQGQIPSDLLTRAGQVTDGNAALFDVAHQFAGCIAGIHEVLRRQGLLENILCLNPEETLSPGQAAEIDRVIRCYPHLCDDGFVSENLDRWMR